MSRRLTVLCTISLATVTSWPAGGARATGGPTDPAPVGTVFEYSDGHSGTSWTGTVLGIIDLPRSEFGEGAPGRCIGVVGTLSPTATEGLTSEPYSSPPITVVAGGRAVDSLEGILECETQSAVDAGWGRLSEAAVTVGTTYPFVEAVFLAGDPAPAPELIAVGDTSSSDAMYYQPTLLTELPPVPEGTSTASSAPPGGAATATPLPVGSPFDFSDPYSDTSWTGTVLGIVALPRSQFSDGAPGTCFGIVGSLTPTAAEGLTSDPYSTPAFTAVIGGRAIDNLDSLFECDYQTAEAAGWGLRLDAEVTVGTVYPFLEPVFIAGAEAAVPELIAVGDTSSTDAIYFEPTELPELPPLPTK
jgi:hypothetical protein